MQPLWNCDWHGCDSPAVQRAGDCLLCNRHLCRTHLSEPWHTCPEPETHWEDYSAQFVAQELRRLSELCQRVNVDRLCERASQARGGTGMPCTIDLSPEKISKMMGGQNCHADVIFADGCEWLVRIRLLSAISPPQQVRDYVLQSEATTMEFLQNYTQIPSPRIYDWACESDPSNTVGVGFILMEKMQGNPLDWQGATPTQKEKVLRQFADIMLELERHPFDAIGSLVQEPKTTSASGLPTSALSQDEYDIQVKGLAQHSTFQSGESGRPLGPFRSSRDALSATVEAHLRMMASGEIGSANNAVDLFLAHKYRLEIIQRLNSNEEPAAKPPGGKEQYFLKHADDKGDHILVDNDFNITGIIDWEWCSTVPKDEAFASPCMMWPVAKFYDGSNELSEEELLLARVFSDKGRDDLERIVLEGRKAQRFHFALGPGGASSEDSRVFGLLFMGLKQAFDSGEACQQEARTEQLEAEWRTWRAAALVRWQDDVILQAIEKSKSRMTP